MEVVVPQTVSFNNQPFYVYCLFLTYIDVRNRDYEEFNMHQSLMHGVGLVQAMLSKLTAQKKKLHDTVKPISALLLLISPLLRP